VEDTGHLAEAIGRYDRRLPRVVLGTWGSGSQRHLANPDQELKREQRIFSCFFSRLQSVLVRVESKSAAHRAERGSTRARWRAYFGEKPSKSEGETRIIERMIGLVRMPFLRFKSSSVGLCDDRKTSEIPKKSEKIRVFP
jgi:hypothetical protein